MATTGKPTRIQYEHNYREYFCRTSERAPGKDRSADDGLQAGPDRSQGRHGAGGRRAAQEGHLGRRQEGEPRHQRRLGGQLHSRRRQDRRAGGSELRERLRGPHRRLQGTGARHRHAHRGQRSRSLSARKTSRRKLSSARRTSIARRPLPPASRPRLWRRSSKAR